MMPAWTTLLGKLFHVLTTQGTNTPSSRNQNWLKSFKLFSLVTDLLLNIVLPTVAY